MYDTYIYMVHMSTYMVHVCFMYICIHIHTLTIIVKEKKVLFLWGNKEGIREKRLGRNWRQKRERGKRCNYSLN